MRHTRSETDRPEWPVWLDNPLNPDHWHNRGLAQWLYGAPPLDGGQWWYDLCGLNHYPLNTNTGCSWLTGPRNDSIVRFSGGTSGIGGSTPQPFSGGEFTLFCWSNLLGRGNTSSHRNIRFRYHGMSLQANGGANLGFVIEGNSWVTSSRAQSLGTWEPTFLTRTSAGLKTMYATSVAGGGPLTSICSSSASPSLADTNLMLVSAIETSTILTDLGDVTIWSRVLSLGEMSEKVALSWQGYPGVLNRWRPSNRTIFLPVVAPSTKFLPAFSPGFGW